MRRKTAGKSFRKINLAHTDDFGQKNDKIRLWVINNGGTFSRELNDGVTHLVCSRNAWRRYEPIGKLIDFKMFSEDFYHFIPSWKHAIPLAD
jgi:twin BRCT domain